MQHNNGLVAKTPPTRTETFHIGTPPRATLFRLPETFLRCTATTIRPPDTIMFPTLSPLDVPLEGTNLIEASAGTGKTWNIAALFTRLILLEQYGIERILVVTFTKAATAELKTRLRERLDNALYVLKQVPDAREHREDLKKQCGGDVFLYNLLEQALFRDNAESQSRLQLRLQAAIGNFDNAAVYTIHGFCQRVLQDFAFYCQVPFQIELDESKDRQTLTFAQDFWRTHITRNRTLSELVYAYRETPQSQLQELRPYLARPYLAFRQPESKDLSACRQAFEHLWQRISQSLPEIEAAFWRLQPNLKYYKTETYQNKFQELRSCQPPRAHSVWQILQNSSQENPFTEEALSTKTKKGKTLDSEDLAAVTLLGDLGESCLNLLAAEQHALAALSQQLCAYLQMRRQEEKKSSPMRRFDDLLLDVFQALQTPSAHAQALSEAMANNWPVALIDEFQDTDPLQYAIFRTAFSGSRNGRQPVLFMVGDPKQAIYGFRGADIFAYLDAARHAQHRYTLSTNRRSHAKLVNSVNALFSRPHPFVLPEIGYTHVKASRTDSRLQNNTHPVRISCLNSPDTATENADTLGKRAVQWCAAEIARTLQAAADGEYLLNGKAVHAGQIAVLVRARKDGAAIQRALKRHRIQSVLLSRDSIFAESEAEALYALLEYFLHPQQTGLLHFVLSGSLFNHTAEQIGSNSQDSRWADSALLARDNWQQHGVYTALQHFFRQHRTEAQLIASRQDRTLTNLHQLMEILAAEDADGRTPTALLQWFGRQIQAAKEGEPDSEERLLRLESDEHLVKIVTVHASKGLQYPIVYCPFAWKSSGRNKQSWQIVHTPEGNAELIYRSQLAADPEAQERLAAENLSEDLRLLYVALTRAQEQLNLYTAHYRDSNNSPFAYLLQAQDAKNSEQHRAAWQHFIERQNPYETGFVFHTGEQPEHRFSGSLKRTGTETGQYRAFRPAERPCRFIRHASFSSLTRPSSRHIIEEDTLAEWDDPAATSDPSENFTLADLEQGAKTGRCLHEILEKARPDRPAAEQHSLIADILGRYGFPPEPWLPAVTAMCDAVYRTPLLPDTRLYDITANDRLPETEFLFHTEDFSLDTLKQWFGARQELSESIKQAAQTLDFKTVNGYIGGFIDLLCRDRYGNAVIIDYKSNYLGADPGSYVQAAMDAAIAEHHYYLQAFIYAVAAARYFRSRQAEPEYIAVRYLFLRGTDGSGGGVWAWNIPLSDLETWL